MKLPSLVHRTGTQLRIGNRHGSDTVNGEGAHYGPGRLPARLRGRAIAKFRDLVRRAPGTRRVWHRVKHGTPLRMPPVSVTQPRDRGEPPTDRKATLARYRASEVTKEPDDFVLYRIIGNDLPPRHEVGQARRNLKFILEHEPEFPGCEKRFILNRVVDQEEERCIVNLLEEAGATYFRIPFNWAEYAQVPLDVSGVPGHYSPDSEGYAWLREDQRERVRLRLYRYKNNYVMNNNGARNVALEEGRTIAKWLMPWDGNCFLAKDAYEELRNSIHIRPDIPYWLVRMVRLDENLQLFRADTPSDAVEEPQIVFRRDAAMSFDPAYQYGRRSKVELLWRLGVPGPWDEWGIEPWDLPCPDYHTDVGAFQWAGWVARLAATCARPGPRSDATERMLIRRQAIVNLLDCLDRKIET